MRRRDLIAALAGAALATVFAGGVAWSAIGDGGVIQGCHDSGGNLKVVASLPCPKGYTSLPWNQQGPKGADGEQGAPGPQGPAGVSGYEIVPAIVSIAPGASAEIVVTCPDEKTVIQGAWTRGAGLSAADEFFTFSGPPSVSGSYHVVVVHESGVGRFPVDVVAFASCISA